MAQASASALRPPSAAPRAGRIRAAFTIPGVFGEEPSQAQFRSRLSGCVELRPLDLPDIRTPRRLLTDMAATGRCLIEEIAACQPTGPVALIGFSFGASLALEVACQLERIGREVSYLGILDGPLDALEMPALGATPVARATPGKVVRAVAAEAVNASPAVRRLILSVAALGAPDREPADSARRAMLWHLRSRALTQWTPAGCAAPGLHVTTGWYGEHNRERWAALCPGLKQVHIPTVHEDLMRGDAFEALVAAVEASIRAEDDRGRASPPGRDPF